MEPLFETVIQKFLRQSLIDNPYIYIDYYSFVHFGSGLILGFLFSKYYPRKYSWFLTFLILVLYEVVEPLLNFIIFLPENFMDAVWDVIIGQTGFFLSYYFVQKRYKSSK